MAQDCASCFAAFTAPLTAGPSFAGKLYCTRNAPAANNQNPTAWLWPLVQADWTCREGADAATGQSYASQVNSIPGTGGPGPGYLATSTTSATIASSGSIAVTTQLLLAYTPGARVRLTSRGSGAFAEGVVASYDAAGLLTFTADLASGSGSHTDWDINLAGQPGTASVAKGSFTFTASPLVVADVNVQAGSRIFFQASNNSAALLVAGITGTSPGQNGGPFVSSRSTGVSFTVTGSQSGGGGPDGSETFDYLIVN